MDILKLNNIIFVLILLSTSSCTSTNQLLQSEQIYLGMSSSQFCQKVLMTSLNEDPCIGKREYYPLKKVMVLSGEYENKYFVFKKVSDRNTNLNTSTTSQLVLITSSQDEVEFYITNFIN